MNEGIVNFLPGAVIGIPHFFLSVNNPNTAAGTAVTVNLQQSQSVESLSGTIAVPSSGTNTATVNLVGTGTILTLALRIVRIQLFRAPSRGKEVSLYQPMFVGLRTQTFAGNNTYSGTTSIGYGATLEISGITSGQGNYTVDAGPAPGATPTPKLFGGGTIGLAANGTIKVLGDLAPGPASGIGILHVNASGTGGVIFDGGTLKVRVEERGLE